MDEIQKILIEAGRKDLAQKYYKKISKSEVKEINNAVKQMEGLSGDIAQTGYDAKKTYQSKSNPVTQSCEKALRIINKAIKDIKRIP